MDTAVWEHWAEPAVLRAGEAAGLPPLALLLEGCPCGQHRGL